MSNQFESIPACTHQQRIADTIKGALSVIIEKSSISNLKETDDEGRNARKKNYSRVSL